MQDIRLLMTKEYLYRFDQILNNMGDQMLSANIINNITIDFIRCMIPHHEAAIYMCENLLKYTEYIPLIRIANGIIQMQTRGIKQMKEILKTTQGYNNTKEQVNNYMKKYLEITNTMLNRMKNSPRCANINLNFVGEMIPHHEGAIAMCENLLQYKIDPRLSNVAKTIIKEQSQGVKELNKVREILCK